MQRGGRVSSESESASLGVAREHVAELHSLQGQHSVRAPASPAANPRELWKWKWGRRTRIAPFLSAFCTSLKSSIPAASMTCLTASRADDSRLPNPLAERIDSSSSAASSSSRPKYWLRAGRGGAGRGGETSSQRRGESRGGEEGAERTWTRWRSRPRSPGGAAAPRASRWRRTTPSGGTCRSRCPFGCQTSCGHSPTLLQGAYEQEDSVSASKNRP